MSRHRNIRNLDEDDYYDDYDDDYYEDDEYYDEDEYYLEQQREQERKKKEEAERKAKQNQLKQQQLQQQKLKQQQQKEQQQKKINDAKKKSSAASGGGGGICIGKPPPGFTVESKKKGNANTTDNNNNTTTATTTANKNNMPIPQLPPNILATLRSDNNTGEAIRPHLSLVILGHVDAGKSTLTGRLLLSLNHVSQRLLQKYQKAATSIGKSSFARAYTSIENTYSILMKIDNLDRMELSLIHKVSQYREKHYIYLIGTHDWLF